MVHKHKHKYISRYQRWGRTDEHRCVCKGLYVQTQKQMGRQVYLSVLREKSTFVWSRFPGKENQDQQRQEKIKAPVLYFKLNYCYRHFRDFHKWCDNVMDLSENKERKTLSHMRYYWESPSLTGLNWELKLFFLMLRYHGRVCGAYLLGSPSASNSFPMSCSYDVPTVALLLPAATVRWYSQVF